MRAQSPWGRAFLCLLFCLGAGMGTHAFAKGAKHAKKARHTSKAHAGKSAGKSRTRQASPEERAAMRAASAVVMGETGQMAALGSGLEAGANMGALMGGALALGGELRLTVGPGPAEWPGQGDPVVERARRCIVRRESKGHYEIVDRKHRWFGAYQFDPKTADEAARRMKRPDLVGVPAHHWTKEEQDAAFYLIYNRGRGKNHWKGGLYPCF